MHLTRSKKKGVIKRFYQKTILNFVNTQAAKCEKKCDLQ